MHVLQCMSMSTPDAGRAATARCPSYCRSSQQLVGGGRRLISVIEPTPNPYSHTHVT
jgi:hypothetical protein